MGKPETKVVLPMRVDPKIHKHFGDRADRKHMHISTYVRDRLSELRVVDQMLERLDPSDRNLVRIVQQFMAARGVPLGKR